jgi:hypothetical protein
MRTETFISNRGCKSYKFVGRGTKQFPRAHQETIKGTNMTNQVIKTMKFKGFGDRSCDESLPRVLKFSPE